MAAAQLRSDDITVVQVSEDAPPPSTSMALPSVSSDNPDPPSGPVSFDLSDKTYVTAHLADKWKSGYLTITRRPPASKDGAPTKGRGRNVHLSKKSFEKLGENLTKFVEALKRKTDFQLMLTKKQHMMTTDFVREGKDTLRYVSILHPAEESESLKKDDAINHFKTINLAEAEFEKLCGFYPKLTEVVNLKSTTPKNDNDESTTLDGYRWGRIHKGRRSSKLYLTLKECKISSAMDYFDPEVMQAQPMETENHEDFYLYEKVTFKRPLKLEVIEHLAYEAVCRDLRAMKVSLLPSPPDAKSVDEAIADFDEESFKILVRKVLMKLSYKNVYMTTELVNMFIYYKGFEKVRMTLVKHLEPSDNKMFGRLLDYCFEVVNNEMNNKD